MDNKCLHVLDHFSFQYFNFSHNLLLMNRWVQGGAIGMAPIQLLWQLIVNLSPMQDISDAVLGFGEELGVAIVIGPHERMGCLLRIQLNENQVLVHGSVPFYLGENCIES